MPGERVLTHNLIVGAGTMSAGVLGVAFQSLVSHQLRPADYGAAFAVVTLITFIGLPASAFTLMMARETSRGRASGHQAPSAALLRGAKRALLLLGVVFGSAIATGSVLLSRFLAVPVELLLAASVGIPFGFVLPLLLGELQGEEHFAKYAILSTGQAGLKLLGAVALGLVFGPLGVIAGISVATIIVYAIAVRMVRRKLSIHASLPWLRPAGMYLAIVLPSTLALAVLLSSDVLLVKHYFPTRAAHSSTNVWSAQPSVAPSSGERVEWRLSFFRRLLLGEHKGAVAVNWLRRHWCSLSSAESRVSPCFRSRLRGY